MSARTLIGFLLGVAATAVVALGLASSDLLGGDDDGDAPAAAATPTPRTAAAGGRGGALTDVADLYERVSPGVVQVATGSGNGSGFLIDDKGLIVTNQHVVSDAREVRVRFGDAREPAPARVLGRDASTDLAALRVDPGRIPDEVRPLELASSKGLRPGEAAIAIGSPFGLEGSVTSGIVSALDREIESPNGFPIPGVLQTDAAINPGNSGGPLLDAEGKVIGVNSQIATGGQTASNSGVGFAVPSDTVRDVIPRLERDGRIPRAYLGVSTGQSPSSEGAVVGTIAPGGPAAGSGLRPEDRIIALDGDPIRTPSDLGTVVLERKPGEEVGLEVVGRGGEKRTVRVRLGERPEQAQTRSTVPTPPTTP